MKIEEFIRIFEDIVAVPSGSVTPPTPLDSLEEWDSLSIASLLTVCEEHFDLRLDVRELRQASTFSDILELVNGKFE